jgi:hypothetical protein
MLGEEEEEILSRMNLLGFYFEADDLLSIPCP